MWFKCHINSVNNVNKVIIYNLILTFKSVLINIVCILISIIYIVIS